MYAPVAHRGLLVAVTVLMIGLFAGSHLSAAASSPNISHAYKGSPDIIAGSLLSLDAGPGKSVTLANTDNAPKLVGVAVGENDSLVAIDSGTGFIQVATSGIANTLISTLNGEIKVGDQISVSPFSGVGMKAAPGSRLIGLAQGELSNTSAGISIRQVKDKSGKVQTVHVGYAPVSIAIGTAAQAVPTDNSSGLQAFVQSLAGHKVSTVRVVISSIIAVVALFSLITLVYTSIYGSIIAVGRNPLAKKAIFRTLGSVLGMAFMVAAVAMGTILLIVR